MQLKKAQRGDTFVEVCFALAIFSFLAVLAIGSMNRNLSTVQSTLEGEVSRSEVDAQTEAIRFIHETYVGGLNTGRGGNLAKAWSTITSRSISPNEAKTINQNWPPSNCQTYINQYREHMMIVNTRNLNNNGSDIIIDGKNHSSKFQPTSVIPRLVYKNDKNNQLSSPTNLDLESVQGVWFYAVKGNDSKNDFYDMYIQSCWYSMDSSMPRTIDTVIRLYDPSYVDNIASTKQADYEIHFNANGGKFPSGKTEEVVNWPGATQGFAPPTDKVPKPTWLPDNHEFVGWSKTKSNTNPSLNPNYNVSDAKCSAGKCVITVYAVWEPKYQVHYQNSNMIKGTAYNMPNPAITPWQKSPKFSTGIPTIAASDGNCYKFAGWSRSQNGSAPLFSASNITLNADEALKTVPLYAAWTKTTCGAFKIQLTWGSTPRDLDAHFSVNANGVTSHTYYGDKNTILASGAGTVKVILDRDITDGSGRPETSTVTVNNLSGFSAVYYVHNYTGRSGGSPYLTSSGAVVKLTEEDSEGRVVRNYEYRCPTTGTGTYWNVFKIVNRQVIETNTITTKEPSA